MCEIYRDSGITGAGVTVYYMIKLVLLTALREWKKAQEIGVS